MRDAAELLDRAPRCSGSRRPRSRRTARGSPGRAGPARRTPATARGGNSLASMYFSQCGVDLAVEEPADGGAERLVVVVVDRALHGRHRRFGSLPTRSARCCGGDLSTCRVGRDSDGCSSLGSLIVTDKYTQGDICGDLARQGLPARRHVRRQRDQLRPVQRGGRARRAVPVRDRPPRGDQRDAGRADRGRRLRLALLPAHASSPDSATATGCTARGTPRTACAATPTSCCSTPTPRPPPARSTGTSRCSATTSATRTRATTTTRPRT